MEHPYSLTASTQGIHLVVGLTSYLIDGLDGDAADKDGIISIEGLRNYIENKMTDKKNKKA